MDRLTELSKEISYALRHAPWEYELEMDEEGWVPIEQLLDALHRKNDWKSITQEDIQQMIDISEKKRHEIVGSRIRAFYGHSIPMKISKIQSKPPEILYHGTARRFMESIVKNGLAPQSRQYVHLSQDVETAQNVGKRHDDKPYILRIDSLRAWNDGISFYYGMKRYGWRILFLAYILKRYNKYRLVPVVAQPYKFI